jgi:transcriptional regulator with XRE-family HTH domain
LYNEQITLPYVDYYLRLVLNHMRCMNIKYPNKLKELRKSQGLLQRELASILNFRSEDRICRWERGQSIPSIPNLIKLCKVYNVQLGDIYPEL